MHRSAHCPRRAKTCRSGHPTRPANSYAVADLDYVEGYRGAARIVYDRRRTGEGAIWITVDHYDSFTAVPVGQ